jgi:hypothetical protein
MDVLLYIVSILHAFNFSAILPIRAPTVYFNINAQLAYSGMWFIFNLENNNDI